MSRVLQLTESFLRSGISLASFHTPPFRCFKEVLEQNMAVRITDFEGRMHRPLPFGPASIGLTRTGAMREPQVVAVAICYAKPGFYAEVPMPHLIS